MEQLWTYFLKVEGHDTRCQDAHARLLNRHRTARSLELSHGVIVISKVAFWRTDGQADRFILRALNNGSFLYGTPQARFNQQSLSSRTCDLTPGLGISMPSLRF